jgi:hypothetical protein
MDVKEFENGAILRGRHLVTFEDGAGTGGALPNVTGFEYKSDVRDRYNNANDIGNLRRIVTVDGEAVMIKSWGKDNQAPLRLDESIRANHILPSLLDTKRKIILGQRLYMYYERWENDAKGKMTRIEDEEPMPAEIEDFMLESEEHRYFQQAGSQLVKNGNALTEFLPTKDSTISGRKIAAMKAHEAKFWRKEQMNTEGVVANAVFSGDAWCRQGKHFPMRKAAMWQGLDNTDLTSSFLYWTGDSMFCPDDYYFSTIWNGSLTWAGLMNIIPLFHDNNLKHRYITPMHIRIRKGMFLDKKAYDNAKDVEAKTKILQDETTARTAWLESANKVLAGYENAGRAIWSEEEVLTGVQKQFPDVEIVPLDIKLHDDALLKLHEAGSKAVMSSAQIHPTIANIETAGKLSSGSEMRNAVLMQRLIHTPLPRQILLEPIYIKSRIDDWVTKYAKNGRSPRFGFADEDIVSLSVDKTGSQPTKEQN